MASGRIVVVGASAGGVRALQFLASRLPPDFPAPILAVQHIGSHRSVLPDLLARNGPLSASHATDGEALRPGHIHLAPPDHHMMVSDATIRLSRGPKENHSRPAIDPLFRSVAIEWGAAAIGVLLTGHLDDGTAGFVAIKQCGGTTVVQDPDEAEAPSMPASALRYAKVDYTLPLVEIGGVLAKLADTPPTPVPTPALATMRHENEIMRGSGDFMTHLQAIGKPSMFVCPDCDGGLWEIAGASPPRYRCHTGHAYSLRNLQHAQAERTDEALWSAFRALQERELLLRTALENADLPPADLPRVRQQVGEIGRHAETLRELIERVPPGVE